MNDAEIPEVDRQDGTNHPRHTKILYGHKTSQLDFLDAFNTDRLASRLDDFWPERNW
jgi:hypothetical protein